MDPFAASHQVPDGSQPDPSRDQDLLRGITHFRSHATESLLYRKYNEEFEQQDRLRWPWLVWKGFAEIDEEMRPDVEGLVEVVSENSPVSRWIYKTSYDSLLSWLFPPSLGFTVIDSILYSQVLRYRIPVLFLDITEPSGIATAESRVDTDLQMRKRLYAAWMGQSCLAQVPVLYGISAAGPWIRLYEVLATPSCRTVYVAPPPPPRRTNRPYKDSVLEYAWDLHVIDELAVIKLHALRDRIVVTLAKVHRDLAQSANAAFARIGGPVFDHYAADTELFPQNYRDMLPGVLSSKTIPPLADNEVVDDATAAEAAAIAEEVKEDQKDADLHSGLYRHRRKIRMAESLEI